MRIILSIILLFALSGFSTPSFDFYEATKDSNIVYSSSDSGIVICDKDFNSYYVTRIEDKSYSFYPNYILGKNSKGFFSFNETTKALKYFETVGELNEFKKIKGLRFSFAEKRQIQKNSSLLSFFALVVILFLIVFWKYKNIEVSNLKSRILICYLMVIFLSKIFNIVFAYIFLYDPRSFFSSNSVFLILLYSAIFISPWLITFIKFGKITTKIGLKWHTVLFIILIALDFWVVTGAYNLAELIGYFVIVDIIVCNLILLCSYSIVLFVRKFVIKNIKSSNSRKLELGRNKSE